VGELSSSFSFETSLSVHESSTNVKNFTALSSNIGVLALEHFPFTGSKMLLSSINWHNWARRGKFNKCFGPNEVKYLDRILTGDLFVYDIVVVIQKIIQNNINSV
jgi:hypothetical protein